MPIYSSDSDSDDHNASTTRLFGRERPLHAILGGGQVADMLLWRNKSLSAAILIGVTMIWYLFEVVEYNLVSLLCHISMLVMLLLFITYTVAEFANWSLPDIHEITIQESAFRWLFKKINWLLLKFYDISSGKDFARFFLVIVSLWILSLIGNYFNSLNLLYICFLCLQTLPALYERYEREVDHHASRGNRAARKLFRKFDSKILNKIPRGPVKEKKHR